MNLYGKKLILSLTALGLALGSISELAFGATHHQKSKPPATHHTVESAVDKLKFIESGGLQKKEAAYEAYISSLGQGMPGPGSKEAAHLIKLQNAVANIPQKIAALENRIANSPDKITVGDWHNLQTRVDDNTGAIINLNQRVNYDVGNLQSQITADDKSIASNTSEIKANADRINSVAALARFDAVMSLSDALAISKNAKAIVKNSELIAQNSKAIGLNHQEILANLAKIEMVATQVKKNADFIAKNAKMDKKNAKEILEAKKRIRDNMQLLVTYHGDLEKVVGLTHRNAENIKSNLALIHKNLGLINQNSKAITTADTNIETNAKSIHTLGLAVQKNSNQISRVADNELRNVKVTKALSETVKKNVEGIDMNTRISAALDKQALVDEGALEKLNQEIFENAQALGNTSIVEEDGDSLAVSAKNLANISQLLAVAHHHNAQAKKSIDTDMQAVNMRMQALNIALDKAKIVSAHDARLANALKQPIANAQAALKASEKMKTSIEKQRVRLHMQGKSDAAVIKKSREEATRIAKQKSALIAQKHKLEKSIAKAKQGVQQATKYKKAADKNAKKAAHKLAVDEFYATAHDKQPQDARNTLRLRQQQQQMENDTNE